MNPVFQAVMLTFALSLDTFTAGIALGAQKICLPMRSLMALSLTCSLSLWAAMLLGGAAGEWITPRLASLIGCGVLVVMGSVRLCDGLLKKFLRRCCEKNGGMVLRFKNLKIFLQVCVDCTQADFNRSQSLSVAEAVSLAAALSVDGLAAGFGAGILEQNHWLILCIALVMNLTAAQIGWKLGRHFSERFESNISWVAGVVLIALGFVKLLG